MVIPSRKRWLGFTLISLFVIGFTIRKSSDLSPIKKSGVQAPGAAPFSESDQQEAKERDVAVEVDGAARAAATAANEAVRDGAACGGAHAAALRSGWRS
ncbi:hypothetical protein BLAT2472_90248 [Burkholderia latens]|uniref:hypothetical protein n=1 Tax=Burkholderia TaxID=32008 RepID=UPI0012EAE004|nr:MULTISPECIES: hypothetical protein [Burkholderia]MCA8306950.1 hypothetical protein [Burkholderia sp. AU28942]QTO49035.1 hypothetical protein J8I86_03600 [Burkholderia latens]